MTKTKLLPATDQGRAILNHILLQSPTSRVDVSGCIRLTWSDLSFKSQRDHSIQVDIPSGQRPDDEPIVVRMVRGRGLSVWRQEIDASLPTGAAVALVREVIR